METQRELRICSDAVKTGDQESAPADTSESSGIQRPLPSFYFIKGRLELLPDEKNTDKQQYPARVVITSSSPELEYDENSKRSSKQKQPSKSCIKIAKPAVPYFEDAPYDSLGSFLYPEVRLAPDTTVTEIQNWLSTWRLDMPHLTPCNYYPMNDDGHEDQNRGLRRREHGWFGRAIERLDMDGMFVYFGGETRMIARLCNAGVDEMTAKIMVDDMTSVMRRLLLNTARMLAARLESAGGAGNSASDGATIFDEEQAVIQHLRMLIEGSSSREEDRRMAESVFAIWKTLNRLHPPQTYEVQLTRENIKARFIELFLGMCVFTLLPIMVYGFDNVLLALTFWSIFAGLVLGLWIHDLSEKMLEQGMKVDDDEKKEGIQPGEKQNLDGVTREEALGQQVEVD